MKLTHKLVLILICVISGRTRMHSSTNRSQALNPLAFAQAAMGTVQNSAQPDLQNINVPVGYKLVPDRARGTPGPVRLPGYGKNFARNQRKRDSRRVDQIQAPSPAALPIPTFAPAQAEPEPPHKAGLVPAPVVPQPQGSAKEVDEGQNPQGPSYYTTEYVRAQALTITGNAGYSAETVVMMVSKCRDYFYAIARVLVSPTHSAKDDVIKLWRYVQNGQAVLTGANMMNLLMELAKGFIKYGNPYVACPMLTPVLATVKMSGSHVLYGVGDDGFLMQNREDIVSQINNIVESGALEFMQNVLEALENYSNFYAKPLHNCHNYLNEYGVWNGTGSINEGGQAKSVLDVYNIASSDRYNTMFRTLTTYIRSGNNPILGSNPVNNLLKSCGLSLTKFRGLIQAEPQVPEARTDDGTYPSRRHLQDLCGLPLPASEQVEVMEELLVPIHDGIDKNAEELAKIKSKMDKMHAMLTMMLNSSNSMKPAVQPPNIQLEVDVNNTMVVDVVDVSVHPDGYIKGDASVFDEVSEFLDNTE